MVQEVTPLGTGDTELILAAAGGDYELIRKQITAGRWDFFKVGACAMVTRLEDDTVVVVCAQGGDVVKAAKVLLRMCKARGYNALRFHTKRKGLPRLLKELSPIEQERVYRIEVS